MLKKIMLVVGLCALIPACSDSHDLEQASDINAAVTPASGPLTVQAQDGVEIAATVHNVGDPTLVLVHGWMCDQTYWDRQVPALSEHFGVVSVDLPGHGLSGTQRTAWSSAAFGGDVATVIKQLDLENVIVVGHSMGGRVALEAARLLPDVVIGIIGVDTLQDADAVLDPGEADALIVAFTQDFGATCDAFVRSMFVENSADALVEPVVTDMCSGPAEISVALLRDYIKYDVAAAMRSADVPIHVINADKWPTNVEANRKYADFDAVILEGYGHFLMQEAPQELNKALIESAFEISGGGR